MSEEEKGERIAKRLARAGLCSRRDAERWIADGRVAVDGKVLTTPATIVTEASVIAVDGKPLPDTDRTRLWRYHKPAGLVTSHKDPQGRTTVFERLPQEMPRVISIGRLDLNSEGLLLLTNDGELARRLELPSTGWLRRYRVRIHGAPDVAALAALEKGVTVDGVTYGSIKAVLDRQQGSNAWLTVGLKEGKNREIRKVMEHFGWSVSRLIRIAYGPFQLGLLPSAEVEEVPTKALKEQLGTKGAEPEKPKNMRLVAGKFKGRVLAAPEGSTTRPTADRVRESLFNILAHGEPELRGARVADVFAGSGALGLEALSRGAGHVSFFESAASAAAVIAANVKKLGCEKETALIRQDALKPPKAAMPCQFLLLDPPYKSGLAAAALVALQAQGWIAPDARIIVEVAAAEGFKSPLAGFEVADERKYGAARLVFLSVKEMHKN